MSPTETFAQVAQLMRDGQALESRPSPESLPAALRHYEQAIALLRTLPVSQPEVRHQLALAAMNRGNALQRQNTAETVDRAIQAYDEAIAFFRTLPLDTSPDVRNSLGAVWMNRGHAFHLKNDAAALVESVRCQQEAIAILGTLPLDSHPSFRLNLAAAWMNQANALLAIEEDDRAAEAAREAIVLAAPGERQHPALADVALKARRARCEAIGRLLYRSSRRNEPTDSLADEASDLVDDGLAVARHWEAQGVPHFRATATRLYAFGAQLYRLHLPDFLAEFLLEHLDPEQSSGAMSGSPDLHFIASDTLTQAKLDLESRQQIFLDTPQTARLLDRLRTFRDADIRLAALRARFLPQT